MEVFDDLGGDDVGSGEIGAAFEALKARPLLTRVTASSSQKMSRLNFGACSNVEYLDATPFPQTVFPACLFHHPSKSDIIAFTSSERGAM